MKQEDKELLLKDLCARLPYGVICCYNCVIPVGRQSMEKANAKDELKGIVPTWDSQIGYMVGMDKINALSGDIKPYLRPLSSITEEEKEEASEAIEIELKALQGPGGFTVENAASYTFMIDFYNKHHLDYRGLIEKGFALEAPEGMYKTE